MKPDLIAFLIAYQFVPFLFLFFRSLFFKIKSYKIIFLICVVLSILGIIALAITDAKENKPNFYLILFCPIYQFVLLHVGLIIFRKIKKRNPIDPPRSSFNYVGDRFFYITYMMLSSLVPMAIISCCHP